MNFFRWLVKMLTSREVRQIASLFVSRLIVKLSPEVHAALVASMQAAYKVALTTGTNKDEEIIGKIMDLLGIEITE